MAPAGHCRHGAQWSSRTPFAWRRRRGRTWKLKRGDWQIVGQAPLPGDIGDLLTFHIAGELHEGDSFVRMLSVDEYARYRSMSVLGFELVHRLLSGSQ
ncbi:MULTISPECIES: hypothetical protein [Xanthomonas]|uniref:hypothetical protein n=1 Tax=Xanthomonas TaxID=338 RepID=UPI001FD2308B|nr:MULTISPECIES: hypothetical protein [unclassified Xanthomonas]WNH44958.1 hypothetical protein PG878_00295 [Xanthomonas sp. A6251]